MESYGSIRIGEQVQQNLDDLCASSPVDLPCFLSFGYDFVARDEQIK